MSTSKPVAAPPIHKHTCWLVIHDYYPDAIEKRCTCGASEEVTPDANGITLPALVERLESLQAQFAQAHRELVLTPKQRAEFKRMLKELEDL